MYQFGGIPFYKHDPEGSLKYFCSQHNINLAYAHHTNLQEVYKWSISIHEVVNKTRKKKKETQCCSRPREMTRKVFIQGKYLIQSVDVDEQ